MKNNGNKKRTLILAIVGILVVIGLICLVYIFNLNTVWTITQYGNNEGSQSMFYTIEGNRSGLIIIDGGYGDDEKELNNLRSVIEKHNNEVDAWILTHFDTDHAGAFKTIYNENKDLKLKKLYVQDTPDVETCKAKATWYAGWDLYEWYLNTDIKEKEFLHTGDYIEDIIGLKLEVLSAYDDWVGENTDNLLNNGSIVFKLYGKEESILFLADVQSQKITERLLNDYKDKLPSEYIQIAHHGNGTLNEEFYEVVNPKVAFFSAPESLMKNEGNVSWFTAPQLWEKFENENVKVYYFKYSPTTLIMK